ncbi:MAG: FtsX-like permease family protein [Chloroflexia bacterium]|nr:FtsX-like permease family protein [Chloroflexia bacterium]
MAIIHYLLRRIRRHWQLFLNLGLGVVMATALLASTPLLVDAVLEIGLRHEILAAGPSVRNLNLQCYELPQAPVVQELDRQVRAQLEDRLGRYLQRVTLAVESTWMIPWVGGEAQLDDRIHLRFYEDIHDQVEFLAGDWPAGGMLTDTVPIIIGETMARDYFLEVGDRLPVSFKRDDAQPSAWLQVTGVIRPRNPGDAYWFVPEHPLRGQGSGQGARRYGAVVPAEILYGGAAALVPEAQARIAWNVQLLPERITLAGASDLSGQIAGLKKDLHLGELNVLLDTGLPELLTDFAVQAGTVRGPLYLLMAEIALLVLYYVLLVAALSVQQAEHEFAVLRSRGASGRQILAIQAVEAVLLAVTAFLSGPGLAIVLIKGLSLFGPLAAVAPGDWAVHLTRASWLAAGLGAGVCAVALLLPLGPALRRSIVAHQQGIARPPRESWWQRLYLDVILLLIGLVLLWRLHLYGSIVGSSAVRPQVDWLLLLSPVALLLGSATILLRVLPLLMRLSARVSARGRGLTAPLAMWQVSRNPVRGVLLILLLTLAMSLGLLSTGLNATLDVSESERAQYAVGGDVRLVSSRAADLAGLTAQSGLRSATSVARDLGTVDLGVSRFPRFAVLAVDPLVLAESGTFRDDFADAPLAELLRRIVPAADWEGAFVPLPGRPAGLGLWVWTSPDDQRSDHSHVSGRYMGENDLDRIRVCARLRTSAGAYFDLELKWPEAGDCPFACCADCCPEVAATAAENACNWRYLSGDLPELEEGAYPLSLHSIWIQNRARTERYGYMSRVNINIVVDDLTVVERTTGAAQIVEGFEEAADEWHLGQAYSSILRDTFTAYTGQAGRRLIINFRRAQESIAFERGPAEAEVRLPVLVSPAFLEAAQLQEGDAASAWIHSVHLSLRVVGLVHYFPTVYEDPVSLPAGFMIVAGDPLLAHLNGGTPKPVNANELWLFADDPEDPDALVNLADLAEETWTVKSVRQEIGADPMALGLRSVTFYGYVLTSLLSIVGFATYFYTNARRRELSYGVLRTMGLSPWQLYVSLLIEQVILVLSGLGLGTLLGSILNGLVLPRLPITLGKLPPVPPFRPHTDWDAVLQLYLVLGGTLLLCLALVTLLLSRARIHRVLRIGEE